VFGWAIEWVFFVIELAAAAVYYYTWGRIPREKHLKVGYIYAASSFLTLVIINGILSFMMTPGDAWLSVAGTGKESSQFWAAFFNPTYFPSLLMRTLACVSLAGIYALISYSRVTDESLTSIKVDMVRWSAKWIMPMFILLPVGLFWMLGTMSPESRGILELGMSTIGSGAFTQVTRISMLTVLTTFTIAGVVYFFAYKFPREFTTGHAVAVLALAAVATSSTEYARETVRKPYVISSHMYSNGIRKNEVDRFNRDGYMTASAWRPVSTDQLAVGQAMFRGQCMSCHTETGYRSMTRLLQARDSKAIARLLEALHAPKPDSPYNKYMPPLVGKPEEIEALGMYLEKLSKPKANVMPMAKN